MRNLESRLEKLEQAIKPSPDNVMVVMLVDFVGQGPVRAYKGMDSDFCVERRGGETEEAFAERASAEARARVTPTEGGAIVLLSENERPAESLARAEREAIQETVPASIPDPQRVIAPASSAPRMPTIKGIEGQHVDRPHWMG